MKNDVGMLDVEASEGQIRAGGGREPRAMTVVTIERFGGPEVLQVVERAEPCPGPGEIRVRMAAATLNPTDLALWGAAAETPCRRPTLGGWNRAGGSTPWAIGSWPLCWPWDLRGEVARSGVPNDSAEAVADGMP